jgi:CubicO group peptidase (beta-lactamase class C family)
MKICIELFILLVPLSILGQTKNLKSEINKILRYDTEITFDQTPISIIGIIDRDSTFYVSLKDKKDNSIVDKSTIFEIGSLTKVFTSSLITILVDEGILKVSDKVNKYLPLSYRNPRLEDLTILDLINHYGGFARHPEYFGKRQKNSMDPYAYYTKQDLLGYYKNYVPRNSKKSFSYSNTGYAILEVVIENICEDEYPNILQEKILNPLDMQNSFLEFPEDRSLIQGFNRAYRKVKPWHFESFAASEGLKSTVGDLCLFVRAHFTDEGTPITKIISERIGIEAPTNYNDNLYIGNGWHFLQQKNKYNIVTHTGKTSGHSSFIAFIPETKTGVVILSNSVYGTKDLGFLILRMINDNWNRKI